VRIDDTVERFDDALCGPCEQRPAREHGDVVIRDRHGNWTYQFAVTVDDHEQSIDLVIRGRDLLESTGLQIALGRLIGRTAPARFAHHALVMKSPNHKLSKSDGDTGVREMRAAGWSSDVVIARAMASIPAVQTQGF
jgi:glutamyl-tRNA synthetase/glutamyl-Q tRNA(Asp) synthetase